LVEALHHHRDFGVLIKIVDALLHFDDPRATEAVASTFAPEDWAGGRHTRDAVFAIFKLDPTKA
jgi:hypothetical protein